MDTLISELIGAIANIAVENGKKISLDELSKILSSIGQETVWGDDYSRPDAIIRRAYEHFLKNGNNQTAQNIKDTYVKKDGSSVII